MRGINFVHVIVSSEDAERSRSGRNAETRRESLIMEYMIERMVPKHCFKVPHSIP